MMQHIDLLKNSVKSTMKEQFISMLEEAGIDLNDVTLTDGHFRK